MSIDINSFKQPYHVHFNLISSIDKIFFSILSKLILLHVRTYWLHLNMQFQRWKTFNWMVLHNFGYVLHDSRISLKLSVLWMKIIYITKKIKNYFTEGINNSIYITAIFIKNEYSKNKDVHAWNIFIL